MLASHLAAQAKNLANNSKEELTRQFITSTGTNQDNLILIELQGNVLVSKKEPNNTILDSSELESQIRIGEINLTEKIDSGGSNKPCIYIGNHLLYGKKIDLKNPIAVLRKTFPKIADQQNSPADKNANIKLEKFALIKYYCLDN